MVDTVIRAKVDPTLKDAFYSVCKNNDITPSQAIRRFMKNTVSNIEPNPLTVEILTNSQRGDDVHQAKDIDDLFNQLSI
ncbi:MAG: addiction module antitoxin [Methylococcales symbiont of Hymedesmia sp. n. MRB-2018]|nr:MAG: addiction module antitoxin [Methylococcales symbiont of Hymedesmia sp. n. MRB-2018]KAF3983604.1 MAG: addiction module antitoxin [Methylococcales symbiont of Hymedesmia sp. n. MRB-2018]